MISIRARLAKLEQRALADRWTVGNRAVVVTYDPAIEGAADRAIGLVRRDASVVVALPDNGRGDLAAER